MARTRWLVPVAVAVLLMGACSSDNKTNATSTGGSSSSSGSGGAQTLAVDVDADPGSTSMGFTAFFPNEITVHAGDTIDFTEHFSGEPHTVTFGTLVDQGLPKVDPNASDEPPELKKIAPLLPDGPGDANQVSAQPCFLASGDPPASDACSKDQQKQPAFDGTQTFYNSGFLQDGDQFKVKLADSIKPGTYNYFCTLHRAGMTGKVTVVAAGQKAQTADEVKQAGQKQLTDEQGKLKSTIDAVKTGALPPFIATAAPNTLIAGGFSQDSQGGLGTLFGPAKFDAKVGDKITWVIAGPHSITFGASEAQRTLLTKAPDGSVHVNQEAAAPAGGAGQPQNTPPPSDPNAPPGPPINIDGGSYDGTGLHSSGVVLSFPPQLFSYSLTFTKAGTYDYFCAVHPDMKGTINVT